MITTIARLCALCAACSILQLAMPEGRQSGMRMIGGMLMMHLVISSIGSIARRLLEAGELMHIFEILLG